MHLNTKTKAQHTYDAIVVGSGISGGWAAKELCEKGLKTVLLERGRDVEHVTGYPTATKNPWEFAHRGRFTQEAREERPVLARNYGAIEFNESFWAKEKECPYVEVKPFDWKRGYHVGGRSLMWGRQSYRLSDLDFEANAKEGIAVDWPIRYKDLAPWYSYAERFAGVSGNRDGLDVLPDGEFLPPMEMNCLEKHVAERIKAHYQGKRLMTIGRTANLTVPNETHTALGRAACQYRDLCSRGCPYGAYFSTQSATLPAAARTGNLTLRPFSIVNAVMYDEAKGRATGVRVIDAETGEWIEFYAKVIFLNASTLGTTFILLNSISNRFPEGLGNDSGQVGRNLMDHQFRIGASGSFDGFADKYYYGRRANGIYVPRFRNVGADKRDYLRGFGYQGGAGRQNWSRGVAELGVGADFKEAVSQPGGWTMGMTAFGECLPYESNRVTLNHDVKDKWGQPVLAMDAEFGENENKMRADMMNDAAEMLEAAGLQRVKTHNNGSLPGSAIHEMGTARMGRDPRTSVLNAFNQVHAAPNVFITDGSCMTSSACQNPSLTYMALTARACDHAVRELNRLSI